MKTAIRALLVIVTVGVSVGVWSAYSIVSRGLSTRVPPSAVEERLALTMRALATPRAVRSMKNPVDATPAVLEEGLAHFADHCASCHANDGSGNTEMGRSFYPPVPDMRAARTQALSDGDLFSIIENGIRLTGMPAWGTGTPEGEHGSWGLVHFIRRLPTLTPDDVARMEGLNPRSPEQFRSEEEARRFLEGGSPETQPPTAAHDQHK